MLCGGFYGWREELRSMIHGKTRGRPGGAIRGEYVAEGAGESRGLDSNMGALGRRKAHLGTWISNQYEGFQRYGANISTRNKS